MRMMCGLILAVVLVGCTCEDQGEPEHKGVESMKIHYLEIVTNQVDAVCAAHAAANGLVFGEPDPALGNARTALLPGGGMMGVRAPMHAEEQPVTRPYFLVDDIEAAVAAAEAAGARIALPPMEIKGKGWCAIYLMGDTQHGLWQLD